MTDASRRTLRTFVQTLITTLISGLVLLMSHVDPAHVPDWQWWKAGLAALGIVLINTGLSYIVNHQVDFFALIGLGLPTAPEEKQADAAIVAANPAVDKRASQPAGGPLNPHG